MTNISSRDTAGSSDSTGNSDDRIDVELYGRYLTGELNSEELAQVERWATTPWRKNLLAAEDDTLLPAAERAAHAWAVLWKRLATGERGETQQNIAFAEPTHGISSDTRRQSIIAAGRRVTRGEGFTKFPLVGTSAFEKRPLRRYFAAASLVVLGAIVVGLGRGKFHQHSDVTRTYTTRTGQLARVTLSDGTRIVLGPQTTMRVAGFGSDARTVDIDGLASFNVSRASGAPFLVRTGGATTRVLGTQFIVQRYGTDEGLHVAVVDGKVAVTPGTVRRRSTVVLTAGEVGEISDSLTVVRKADNIDSETSWLRDELAFNRAPVTEVLEALTRWYGYRFRLGDSTLTHESIRIALSTHSASDALSMLKQVLDVNLTFTGDTITLTRRNARHAPSETRRSTYDVWTPSKEVGR